MIALLYVLWVHNLLKKKTIFDTFKKYRCSRPSSGECRTTCLAEYAIRRITFLRYPPYHFFAVSVALVALTCDLIPSNHQKCHVLLIRLSLTHVVARVIYRHRQCVKTIHPGVTCRAKQCNYYYDTCLIKFVIVDLSTA